MAGDTLPFSARDTALVRAVPLFQRLSGPALNALLATATVRAVPRGGDIFLQDEPADRFCVLLEGWVKLYRVNRDGAEAVVHVIAPGEPFAEAAMFASANFPVSAQAITDARVMSITQAAFARSLQADTATAFAMLGSLSLKLRQLVQQIEELQIQSTPQRVGTFLLRFCAGAAGSATINLPIEKALIARRLGMQPETFSRALAKLKPLGVEVRGATVTIGDLDALRRFCHEDPVER